MAKDGSDPVQILRGASNRAESPEWMPDGDYVVAAMGAEHFPAWSQDGAWVAYSTWDGEQGHV